MDRLILPRRKFLLAAPALVLPHRRADAQMMQAIVNGKIPASGPPPGWNLIASVHKDGNGVASSAINTTFANLLVCNAADFNNGGVSAPTDSYGNTWVGLTSYVNFLVVNIYYVVSPTVGAGHTFTPVNAGNGGITVHAFSGANATTPYEGHQNGTTTDGTGTVQPGSVTPGQNNTLIYSGYMSNAGSVGATINSGFASPPPQSSVGTTWTSSGSYFVQATAAAINPTWSSAGTANMRANIAVFKT